LTYMGYWVTYSRRASIHSKFSELVRGLRGENKPNSFRN
jgi:hypothetical protein